MIFTPNEVDRFAIKIRVDQRGCHLWQSRVRRDGYGTFWIRGKTAKAHQVSYQIFKGEIPRGMCVMHSCDVRNCVNPEHLSLGSVADNIRDMDSKGRRGTRAKLTQEQAAEVRVLLADGLSQQKVADMFNVHQTLVSRVKRGTRKAYTKEN